MKKFTPLLTFLSLVVILIALASLSPNTDTVTHEGDTYNYSSVKYQTETLCGVADSDGYYNGGAGVYGNVFLDSDIPKNEVKVITIQIKTYKLIKCVHSVHKYK